MNNIVPFSPAADRLDIRNHAPGAAATPHFRGHFLSIIAFNGAITAETFCAVLNVQTAELQRRKGAGGMWRGWKLHQGEGQVRSRNECADVFLKTDCSHHLFLDADVLPRAEHIAALRRHPEAADSIICGLYCKKQDRIEHPYNSLKDGNPAPNKLGLMEVAKAGTGFMQIPRVAYEKIMAAFPERFYLCDYDISEQGERAKKFSFFFHDLRQDAELGFMRDQSEDWAFCELARAAGVKIYVDVSTTTWATPEEHCVLHKGQATYPLRTEIERLALAEELAAAKAKIADLEQKLSGKKEDGKTG